MLAIIILGLAVVLSAQSLGKIAIIVFFAEYLLADLNCYCLFY